MMFSGFTLSVARINFVDMSTIGGSQSAILDKVWYLAQIYQLRLHKDVVLGPSEHGIRVSNVFYFSDQKFDLLFCDRIAS